MMRRIFKYFFILATFSFFKLSLASSHDFSKCNAILASSKDNVVWIDTWAPKFKYFYDGVPELSPSEAKWLDTELSSKNQQRFTSAYTSKEYAIRYLKGHAQSLYLLTNNFTDTTKNWSLLAYFFIDDESTRHLVNLIKAGVIDANVIPCEWRVFGIDAERINSNRVFYAREILTGNLMNSLKK